MAKNYTVPSDRWVPLSDLMNQDYDHTLKYIIYVNDISIGLLQYTCRLQTPTNKDIGRQYPRFSTIEIGADLGDHVYLKSSFFPINIEITNKIETLDDLLNGDA